MLMRSLILSKQRFETQELLWWANLISGRQWDASLLDLESRPLASDWFLLLLRKLYLKGRRQLLTKPVPANKRLERTRHERASLLSCVGEPLKRIYKASQEKKRIVLPGVPNGFCFSLPAPSSVFQKRTGLCNRIL